MSELEELEAAPKSDQDKEIVPLQLATEAVNLALQRSDDELKKSGFFPLKSADITFKVVSTTGWGLNVTVFVLTLQYSHKKKRSTTITVHFKKDDPKHDLEGLTSEFLFKHKNKFTPLTDELVKQIKSIAGAQKQTVGNLPEEGIDISVDFAVDWNIEGDIKVPTPFLVAGGNLSHESETTHSVKLVFQKELPPK